MAGDAIFVLHGDANWNHSRVELIVMFDKLVPIGCSEERRN